MNLQNFRTIAVLLSLAILSLAATGWIIKRRLEAEGLTVTSWFRSPFKNEEVGGVVNSKHQYFMGFDAVPANADTMAIMRRLGFKKVINEGNHIHGEYV